MIHLIYGAGGLSTSVISISVIALVLPVPSTGTFFLVLSILMLILPRFSQGNRRNGHRYAARTVMSRREKTERCLGRQSWSGSIQFLHWSAVLCHHSVKNMAMSAANIIEPKTTRKKKPIFGPESLSCETFIPKKEAEKLSGR